MERLYRVVNLIFNRKDFNAEEEEKREEKIPLSLSGIKAVYTNILTYLVSTSDFINRLYPVYRIYC